MKTPFLVHKNWTGNRKYHVNYGKKTISFNKLATAKRYISSKLKAKKYLYDNKYGRSKYIYLKKHNKKSYSKRKSKNLSSFAGIQKAYGY